MRNDALEFLGQAPLCLAPRYLGYMLAVLEGRRAPAALQAPIVRGQRIAGATLIDGVAVVPITGPILQRAELFGAFGAVSVADIGATVTAALEDRSVESVLLVVDSPGGEVAGVADLADGLYAARKRKPMMAVADEGIFSAAYWIASAVGPVVLPRTGSVGSIGALAVHTDVSGALEQMGVRMTIVKSGAKKAQFSPFLPLSEAARGALQAEVDRIATLFIDATAHYRGLEPETVRGFEAGTFEGEAAIEAGLADGIATAEEAFGMLRAVIAGADVAGSAHARAHSGMRRERIGPMDAEKPAAVSQTTTDVEAARTEGRTEGKAQIFDLQKAHEEAKHRAREDGRREAGARAAEIIRWCQFAGKPDLAEQYIDSDITIEGVRNELLVSTAGASFEIESSRSASIRQRPILTIEEIYARRRETIAKAAQARGRNY